MKVKYNKLKSVSERGIALYIHTNVPSLSKYFNYKISSFTFRKAKKVN